MTAPEAAGDDAVRRGRIAPFGRPFLSRLTRPAEADLVPLCLPRETVWRLVAGSGRHLARARDCMPVIAISLAAEKRAA